MVITVIRDDKTLAAIEYCRENGIHLLTLPPHSTHKMQPLDRAYFKPLKSAFNAVADSFMVAHPGRRITLYDMASLTGLAFLRTALPEKAVHGFKTCGLYPFDPNVFTDQDFAAVLSSKSTQPQGNVQLSNTDLQTSLDCDVTTTLNVPSVTESSTLVQGESSTNLRSDKSSTNMQNTEGSQFLSAEEYTTVHVQGDGRCLFRSLVVGVNERLKTCCRTPEGRAIEEILNIYETSQADELRAKVIL